MARQVVIVGGGEVGTYLASLLLAGGHQVTVVERQGRTSHACSGSCPPLWSWRVMARIPLSWKRLASGRRTSWPRSQGQMRPIWW